MLLRALSAVEMTIVIAAAMKQIWSNRWKRVATSAFASALLLLLLLLLLPPQ
jgi:hypothetical protein